MTRPLIKICGFTEPDSAAAAAYAGTDFIGLNFWARSYRAVDFHTGRQIKRAVQRVRNPQRKGHKARVVAVFVDPEDELVEGVIDVVAPELLQFHGDETPDFCRKWGRPFIKAHRLRSKADIARIPRYLGEHAAGYLIDAFTPRQPGGTGKMLSAALADLALQTPYGFLAGGLTPDNVGAALSSLTHRPYAVDVASGVESQRGRKSVTLIQQFISEVEAASRA